MPFHVTQCPGCDSTFNTNARILQAAAGKVRCGACLTVFEAADNFIAVNDPDEGEDASVFVGYNPADYFDPSQFISRSALTTPATEPFAGSPVPPASEEPVQENYYQAEEEFLTAVATELEPDQEQEYEREQTQTTEDFELIDLDLFEYADLDLEDSFETESTPDFVAQVADENNPVPDATGIEVQTDGDDVANSVTEVAADEVTDETKNEAADEVANGTIDKGIDEAVNEVIDEIDEAAEETTDELTDDNIDEAANEVIDDSTEAIRARAFRTLLHDDNALEALPQASRTAISQVLPPVELLGGRERQWGRRLLLTIACLFLALALAAQYLWQSLPIYSRTAEWRPLYEFGCRFIACELPVYTEISAIRSDNLVVRSHPTVANALAVSLSFRNTARFPQPFPVLILSFNSPTNAIIALREFAPAEYLDAGLRELQLMPVMSPVQVEIDVMDPGADAVNYTVAFRRP